ncbi:urease accessory protein UreF [Rhizobium oryzicola]|uniref:Urease accessory protein UreF n=1 Tax=Rhizobium oryzicola TaxID=1232668 RepID=A0ABT8SWB4_9HYPH|nr:urease accessory protein UreF [Rhizobium oryzicola]MDO1582173.1 urease accessory protein UreF [Rhizobium oryzicola]
MQDTQALLRLIAWLSPAFPVGGFAYSGGLERAVHDHLVTDVSSLQDWLFTLLDHGSLWNDAVLFAAASKAEGQGARLTELAELGLALAGSAERHLETLSLGKAFLAAAVAWPHPVFEVLPKDCPYPVAVGAVAQAHGIAPVSALAAYLHAGVSQAVSAGIRLGVCGQHQGVALLSGLEDKLSAVAERALVSTLDDLGTAAVQADIATMRHEQQHSRLFRS